MTELSRHPELMRPDAGLDPAPILQVIRQLGAQEMHFNGLCAEFKKMASTWLLATFGGIGFLITAEVDLEIDVFWLIGAVATAGATGIYLLWVVDLLVYQRLLSSAFTWRGFVENEYRWLPQIYDTMMERIFNSSVGFNLAWFYMLGVLVPACVALVSFGIAAQAALGRPILVATAGALIFAGLVLLLIQMHRASTPDDEKLRQQSKRAN